MSALLKPETSYVDATGDVWTITQDGKNHPYDQTMLVARSYRRDAELRGDDVMLAAAIERYAATHSRWQTAIPFSGYYDTDNMYWQIPVVGAVLYLAYRMFRR